MFSSRPSRRASTIPAFADSKTLLCASILFLLLGAQTIPSASAPADSSRTATSHFSRFLSKPAPGQQSSPGLTRIEARLTGITLINRLGATLSAQNQIFLNGSGVAAGDFDRDGWCDLYFCSLTSGNRLYRNVGGFQFADVTDQAGVKCEGQFSTGTVMADLDADGWPDLLVNSIGGGTRFFKNRGNGTFEERTEAGFKRTGGAHSIALADVDGDGDLDVYVANYRVTTVRDQPIRLRLKQVDGKLVVPSPYEDRFLVQVTAAGRGSLIELGEPDVLYLNQGQGQFLATDWLNGRFLDASGSLLKTPPRDWGLAALFCDLNGDLKPDLYVCNDFSSPDRIWLNQGGGLLREAPAPMLKHTSWASMAIDVADIDRDGRMDFFVSDMISQDLAKRQLQRGNAHPSVQSEDIEWDRPQYLRNMLHWNAGDGTFREVALMAGVEASEWTWGVAFLDVDLDGYEDLLLGNGHAFDMQDSDATDRIARLKAANPQATAESLMSQFPPLHTRNVAFRNRGDLTFEPTGEAWGFDRQGITHSLILADLDNDGDMDVITTDLDESPGIYRNECVSPRVAVRLQGPAENPEGMGAEIRLAGPGLMQMQSIHGGGRYLGGDQLQRTFAFPWDSNTTARLEVRWPNGRTSHVEGVRAQQSWVIHAADSTPSPSSKTDGSTTTLLRHLPQPPPTHPGGNERPQDVHTQSLLPLDPFEPKTLVTTLPGSVPGTFEILWSKAGTRELHCFSVDAQNRLSAVALPPELASFPGRAVALHAMPPSFTSPPNQLARVFVALLNTNSPARCDLLELQRTGARWNATPVATSLPVLVGALALADVDKDGDADLFVAGRSLINRYPESAPSYWYRQEAAGWTPATFGINLSSLGLVTAADTGDLNGDGFPDLVVACEWGTPRVFLNKSGQFQEVTRDWGISSPTWNGLWSSVVLADLNHDNKAEIILGNASPNHPWNRFLTPHPLRLYYADWNQTGSGSWACIEAARPGDRSDYFPLVDLETLRARIPAVGQRFESNDHYARTSISEWPPLVEGTVKWLELGTLQHRVLSHRDGKLQSTPLPRETQMTNVRAITVGDVNGDGHQDVYLAQNGGGPLNEKFRHDAGRGLWLLGDGQGHLKPLMSTVSGVDVSEPQSAAEWHEGEEKRALLILGTAGKNPGLQILAR